MTSSVGPTELPRELSSGKELRAAARFHSIDSSKLVKVTSLPDAVPLETRDDFRQAPGGWRTTAPVVVRAAMVPLPLVEHLMRRKKDSALGVKYRLGDEVTNMEGVLHTLVTPIAAVKLSGDYTWRGGHSCTLFGERRLRRVLLCASVHLDFETSEAWYQVCRLRDRRITGVALPEGFSIPSAEAKTDRVARRGYEAMLQAHIIHGLSINGFIPAAHEVVHSLQPLDKLLLSIEALILSPASTPKSILQGVRYLYLATASLSTFSSSLVSSSSSSSSSFSSSSKSTCGICIEILFQAISVQIHNEYLVYRHTTPQGVVDIYDPPSIFVRLFSGDARLLNRLRALAYKYLALAEPSLFGAVRFLAFNDYDDPPALPLFAKALATVPTQAVSKASLYTGPDGIYTGPPTGDTNLALVIKNNSDAFGQNIETEGPGSSLDGIIGCFSDASLVLDRSRPDLLSAVFTNKSLPIKLD